MSASQFTFTFYKFAIYKKGPTTILYSLSPDKQEWLNFVSTLKKNNISSTKYIYTILTCFTTFDNDTGYIISYYDVVVVCILFM